MPLGAVSNLLILRRSPQASLEGRHPAGVQRPIAWCVLRGSLRSHLSMRRAVAVQLAEAGEDCISHQLLRRRRRAGGRVDLQRLRTALEAVTTP